MAEKNHRCAHSRSLRSNRGFTLVEIILAIMLLATGLTTILGLQSSAVSQTIRDQNKEFALLAGRRVLARLEVDEEAGQVAKEITSLRELLEKGDPSTAEDQAQPWFARLDEFKAEVAVEPFGLPQGDPNAMRRVSIRIFWSDDLRDSVTLLYYLPFVPEGTSEDDDEEG